MPTSARWSGQAITRVDADDRSADAILEAIAAGRTTVEGKRTPWRISIRQFAGGVTRRVGRVFNLIR